MKIGDVVKRTDHDGSPRGDALVVTDPGQHWHGKPVAHLSDGSWEFLGNLVILAHPTRGDQTREPV